MSAADFIRQLRCIVGRRQVLTAAKSMARYCIGFRAGGGAAMAVVRPGTLLEQWRVLQACIAADKIVIMQAANTGLTAGSTPNGEYPRDAVIVNTLRLAQIKLLHRGMQVLCFPGATLQQLEKLLAQCNRAPHSVLGSSCIGASVIGGVCNNSGGALVERGPAYTELSLYAQATRDGRLKLRNHLGIALGDTPEEILTNLQTGNFAEPELHTNGGRASDTDYRNYVRDIHAPTPARFNADRRRLHESSGCAGKLAVFAVRLDTFPRARHTQVFYIGTNAPRLLGRLRRDMLSAAKHLPVSAEYMHRDCYDIAKRYGKDTVALVYLFGAHRLRTIFTMKNWLDARLGKFAWLPKNLTDRFMQGISRGLPNILPRRMEQFRRRFQHHLILTIGDGGIDETKNYLGKLLDGQNGDWFACAPGEAKRVQLHRFAAAGAAIRCQTVRADAGDLLALDVALRRNDANWFEELPAEIDSQILYKLYYGHFFCHVFHRDYILKPGADAATVKTKLLALLDQRGAEYPAEHNVGHLYAAKPALAEFYQTCDPTNRFNPGIGGMSKRENYA